MSKSESKKEVTNNLAPFLEPIGFKHLNVQPGIKFVKKINDDSIYFFIQFYSSGDYIFSPFYIGIGKVEKILKPLFQKYDVDTEPTTVGYQNAEVILALHSLRKENAGTAVILEKFKSSFKDMYARCTALLDLKEVYSLIKETHKSKEKGVDIGGAGVPRRLRFLAIYKLCNDPENFAALLKKFREEEGVYEASPDNHRELFEEGLKLIQDIKTG
jgi:hypothetical protein